MSDATPTNAGWFLDEFDAERFWSKVNFKGGTPYANDPLATAAGQCWTFSTIAHESYGQIALFGKTHRAHRVAYRDFGNKLADDLVLDHLCRIHSCVNPAHLELVTQTVNMERGSTAARTHCRANHEYTEANTITQTRNGGQFRICRACNKASKARSYQRHKLASTAS